MYISSGNFWHIYFKENGQRQTHWHNIPLMGCDKNGTLLLPFSSPQNVLSYFNNENHIRKISRKGNVTKYVENLQVKKKQEMCGKLWHPRGLGVNIMLYSGTRENA